MKSLIVVLLAAVAYGQPTNIQVSATATQAILSYTAPSSSACTVEVSEASGLSPVVNDVNASLFASSNADSTALGAGVAGRRQFVVGKRVAQMSSGRMYSRALRADTLHYGRITCGSAATFSFQTAPIAGVGFLGDAFDSTSGVHGNWAMPDFDWTDRNKPVIDPQTGAAMYRITDAGDYGTLVDQTFEAAFQGSGWTSLSNITSGSTGTLATTSNTNAAFVSVDITSDSHGPTFGGFGNMIGNKLLNLGVFVFGSGTDATSANREVDLCLSVDSGQTCHTGTVRATLPQTTAAALSILPTAYQSAAFTGWGNPVGEEFQTLKGSVSVSGSTVTLTKNANGSTMGFQGVDAASWFRPEWTSGTRIYIAGSSPTCSSNYCTISSVANRSTLTLSESGLSLTNVAYHSANFGVRVVKTNATGSVSISMSARLATGLRTDVGAAPSCSPLTVSTTVSKSGAALGRTITGRLCVLRFARELSGALYFVGESEVDSRLISPLPQPSIIPGHAANEVPLNGGYGITSAAFWSTTNANQFFVLEDLAAGGGKGIFSITYSGSGYQEPSGVRYSRSVVGSFSGFTDPTTWNNPFKGALNLTTQISANTTYNSGGEWPAISTDLRFGGQAGSRLLLYVLLQGQDLPCAVFYFDATSGVYQGWYDTLKNAPAGGKWAGCHSTFPYGNYLFTSTHNLNSNSSGVKYGGPFVATITHVKKSGTFSTNTSIDSQTNGSSGAYDSACPGGLPAALVALGASGNNCIQVRISGEPCSSSPSAAELAANPCPWDGAKSWVGSAIAVGDVIQDNNLYQVGNTDAEYMLVVARSGNDLTLLRDSSTGYACYNTYSRGRICASVDPAQFTHANGWAAIARPALNNLIFDPATGAVLYPDDSTFRGHFDIQPVDSTHLTFTGIGILPAAEAIIYVARFNATTLTGDPRSYLFYGSQFSGKLFDTTYTQSYSTGPTATSGDVARVQKDWRHINPSIGADQEQPGQVIGSTLTYTLQSGMSSVYKIAPLNTNFSSVGEYKRGGIIGWAGHYVLGEKSDPSVTLTDSDVWRYCYAYRAGECFSGSSAGDVFAVIPKLETGIDHCETSQISYRAPCLMAVGPAQAQIAEAFIDKSDRAGIFQRGIGRGGTRPGSQYVYTHARSFGASNRILATQYHTQGTYSGAVLIDPGRLPNDNLNRTTFIPIYVSNVPANSIVEFGYDTNFYCKSGRAEVCKVAAATVSQTTPFYFAHETLTASSGTIAIPALAGRVIYYRVVTGGVPGPTQIFAVR